MGTWRRARGECLLWVASYSRNLIAFYPNVQECVLGPVMSIVEPKDIITDTEANSVSASHRSSSSSPRYCRQRYKQWTLIPCRFYLPCSLSTTWILGVKRSKAALSSSVAV